MEHVLLTFWTHLGHAKIIEKGLCVLEFLESWEVHQADLVFGSSLYFVVIMMERNRRCFDGTPTPISTFKDV